MIKVNSRSIREGPRREIPLPPTRVIYSPVPWLDVDVTNVSHVTGSRAVFSAGQWILLIIMLTELASLCVGRMKAVCFISMLPKNGWTSCTCSVSLRMPTHSKEVAEVFERAWQQKGTCCWDRIMPVEENWHCILNKHMIQIHVS